MKKPILTNLHPTRAALAALESGGPAGTLEAWRRLVASAIRGRGMSLWNDDDFIGDVVSALFEKLLRINRERPETWRRLLAAEEPSLNAELRKIARTTALDLDPARNARKALAQQVGHVLQKGVPANSVPPLGLRVGGRLWPPHVAAAAAWALRQPDAPVANPYAIAAYLLRAYRTAEGAPGAGTVSEQVADDPASVVERSSHARRVQAQLRVRLDPEEERALELQLDGQTIDFIATALGCGRTRAHAVATRARRRAEKVVAELEAEWRAV